MREAVFVTAIRTPVGRAHKGNLKDTRTDDLGGFILREAFTRTPWGYVAGAHQRRTDGQRSSGRGSGGITWRASRCKSPTSQRRSLARPSTAFARRDFKRWCKALTRLCRG